MSANGQLVFTDVDKVTFKGVGNTSNAVIDTLTGKIGVGVDSPDANLHVVGNCFVSTNFELGGTMTMGTVTVEAQHELSAITATGNLTPHTIQFTNPTTAFTTTGNVEVGKELTVTGNVAVDTDTLFVDTVNDRVGVGTASPDASLHVTGNAYVSSNFEVGGGVELYNRLTINSGLGNMKKKLFQGYNNAGSTQYWKVATGSYASGYDHIKMTVNMNRVDKANSTRRLVLYADAGSLTFRPCTDEHDPTSYPTDLRVYKNTSTSTFDIYIQIGSYSYADVEMVFSGTTIIVYDTATWTTTEPTTSGTYTLEFTNGNLNAMKIDNSGNVGIGTTSPAYKLNILTDTNYDGISLRDTTRELLKIAKGNDGAYINMFESGVSKVNISTGGDSYFTGGNVGIGTTSPIAALDIDGGPENDTVPALSIRGGFYSESDLYVLNTYNASSGVGYAAKVIGVNIKNKVETDNTIQIRSNTGGLLSAGAMYFGSDNYAQGAFGVLTGNGVPGTALTERFRIDDVGKIISYHEAGFVVDNPASGDGDDYAASSLDRDWNAWVNIFQDSWVGGGSGWGTFWAGSTGAAYRKDAADTNPNEYVFVGAGQKRFTFELNNGQAYFDAGLSQNNYDYAEYFEWEDGNIDDEDRRGYSVVLGTDGKIIKATSDDEPTNIIGIVSGTSGIVGDAACYDWHGKYQVDEWGARLTDEVYQLTWTESGENHSYDEDRVPEGITVPENVSRRLHNRERITPGYDDTKQYIPRDKRKEWCTVGLLGKVRLRDGSPKNPNWRYLKTIAGKELWLIR